MAAVKNTNSVAEDNKNVKERGEEKLPALFSFTRATSQSPCLHETLATAAIT